MDITRTSDTWWKNAVFYCLDVETFQDSDGDGVGDFVGLTQRIDYLAGLGITCLWLMPFYPSPDRDDGYDITDYCDVDPRFAVVAIATLPNSFHLENQEEAFSNSVVPAVSLAAHAADEALAG